MERELDNLLDELCQEIRESGSAPVWPDDRFFSWADRISRLQAHLDPLRREPVPADLVSLEQLPCVTTDAFRYARIATFPASKAVAARFLTSGTTALHRGAHLLYRTDIYDCAALAAFKLLVLSRRQPARLISLVPPHQAAPESSLSYMVDRFARICFPRSTDCVIDHDGLRVDWLASALTKAEKEGVPALVFSTTLAAQAMVDTGMTAQLPPGSLLMTTGGAKGHRGSVNPDEVDRILQERLGGPQTGSEYGMTELLSQAYRFGGEPYQLPPWCRVLAFDPTSGRPSPHGKPGLLRFIDLANIQSAIAIQTADLGNTASDQSFFLVGRMAGAQARGCSLTYEELVKQTDDSRAP
ncbi:MAG: hypothetical protein JW797_04630 [Bradymonadales bacterium]|nr:hypothetical protein [Bradymonadales bacterium]